MDSSTRRRDDGAPGASPRARADANDGGEPGTGMLVRSNADAAGEATGAPPNAIELMCDSIAPYGGAWYAMARLTMMRHDIACPNPRGGRT